MTAPAVQIFYNDERIKVAWDVDKTNTYGFFNLYWASTSNMAGEALIASSILNRGGSFLGGDKLITYEFTRASLGLTVDDAFYVRLKGVSSLGVEDAANPGPARIIVALSELREEYNVAQTYGFDYGDEIWRKIAVDEYGNLIGGLTGSSGGTGTGEQGVTGLPGPQGVTGPSGAGSTGSSSGATGIQGETGLPGLGVTGLQGETGVSGLGVTGLQGVTGVSGPQGVTGPSGAGSTGSSSGVTGLQGETGLPGLGVTGIQGETGISGPQGVTGPSGAGSTGSSSGVTGLQGETGLPGLGVTGLQGETGLPGLGVTGVQGDTGPQGIQGITGLSIGSSPVTGIIMMSPTGINFVLSVDDDGVLVTAPI